MISLISSSKPWSSILSDCLWPCCGKEAGLPLWMCHPNDLPDIILKALVQHSVCLIKDQVADPFQVQATHIHQVLQPSRGCNHHLSSPSQGLALLPLGNPSIAAN